MPFIDERDLKYFSFDKMGKFPASWIRFTRCWSGDGRGECEAQARDSCSESNPEKKIKYKIRLPVCEKLFFLIHR